MENHTHEWHSSSYSGGDGADCVEVAEGRSTAVRDSKNPLGPKLTFRADAWTAFVKSLRHPG
ncbi:DUF397 domain-containing protein [Streptomyces sp. BK79]|uniref:DUF397 domain-containing protein n=1 Tax=Streptomyces sp. BK79 TaxID=3350097 RepID=UPI00376F8CA2